MRVNGGDVSGSVNGGEHGGGAMHRSAIEDKNHTNVSVFVHGCVEESISVKKASDVQHRWLRKQLTHM